MKNLVAMSIFSKILVVEPVLHDIRTEVKRIRADSMYSRSVLSLNSCRLYLITSDLSSCCS